MVSALQVLGYHFLIVSIIIIYQLERYTFFEIFSRGIRQGTGAEPPRGSSLRDLHERAQEEGAVCWLECSSLPRGSSLGSGV